MAISTGYANVHDLPLSEAEREVRVQLAAAYRLVDHFGWTELIYGHLTARVPGPDKHFLINPYGLNYDEVTASNLVKIDVESMELDLLLGAERTLAAFRPVIYVEDEEAPPMTRAVVLMQQLDCLPRCKDTKTYPPEIMIYPKRGVFACFCTV